MNNLLLSALINAEGGSKAMSDKVVEHTYWHSASIFGLIIYGIIVPIIITGIIVAIKNILKSDCIM